MLLSLNIVLGLVRPKVSISKGFGLFQQLRYNLSLHFTPGLQSAFYIDRYEVGHLDDLCWATIWHTGTKYILTLHNIDLGRLEENEQTM